MLREKGESTGALEWVERGLALAEEKGRLHSDGFDLRQMRRDLLVALGRGDEVIAEVWTEFRAHPSAYTYADLMKFVPEAERALWHGNAIEAAEGADLHSLLDFERAQRCYEAAGLPGEWQRIVAFVRVEHRRKRGFIDGFEEVVAGRGPSQRPSFLERAKARWGEGGR